MKKISIFMTIGLALVLVLAGCTNEVSQPSFPVSGYVSQIGDFLEGQAFDASKFQVIVKYLDGSTDVVEGASVLHDDKTNDGMSSDDTVYANIGYDWHDNLIQGRGSVSAYPIETIEVTGNAESYKIGEVPTKSGLVVKANYRNREGSMLSINLPITDYKVSAVTAYDYNENEDSLPSYFDVIVTVGASGKDSATYRVDVTGTQEAISAENIVSIDAVEIYDTFILPALAYTDPEDIPVPEFNDVYLVVSYSNGAQRVLASDPGIVFSWVDANEHELVNADLTEGAQVKLTATYRDMTAVAANPAKLTNVALEVTPDYSIVAGEELGTPDAENIIVDIVTAVGRTFVSRLEDNSDVVFTYENADGNAVDSAYPVKKNDTIKIKAEYLGAKGSSDFVTVDSSSVIASINGVSWKGTLYAWDYGDAIVPTFDDVTISVTYKGGESGTIENAEGVKIELLDADGMPLADGNFVGMSQLKVRVTIGDLRREGTVTLTQFDVSKIDVVDNGYEVPTIYAREPLPAIENVIVKVKASDGILDVVTDGVELVYKDANGTVYRVGEEAPVAKTQLYVSVIYNGITDATMDYIDSAKVTRRPTVYKTLVGIEASLAESAVLPEKMASYNAIALESLSVNSGDVTFKFVFEGEGEEPSVSGDIISRAFSTTPDTYTAPEATSFNGESPLYIYVAYETAEGEVFSDAIEVTDKLTTAYPTGLEAEVLYNSDVADLLVGDAIKGINVNALNGNGVVAVLEEGEYRFLDANNNFVDPVLEVGAKESPEYRVTALVDTATGKQYMTSYTGFKIAAGKSWIAAEAIDEIEFALAFNTENRIGMPFSANATNYVVASDYSEYVHTGSNGTPEIKVTAVSVPAGKLEAEGNTVMLTISYTDENGDAQTKQLPYTFSAISWVDPNGDGKEGFAFQYFDGENWTAIDKTLVTGAHNVADFRIDPTSYVTYGTVETVPTLTISRDGTEYTGDIFVDNDVEYEFTVTYTGATANTVGNGGLWMADELPAVSTFTGSSN